MKKFRGQKRYFRNLEKYNDFEKLTELTFNNDSWFDGWHTHYDWKGIGNESWKIRKPHLDTLFRNFENYPDKLENIKKPFQLFIELYDFDSSYDAIFIHTENPNSNNFPFDFQLEDKSTLKNPYLIEYLKPKLKDFEIRYGRTTDGGYCILYKLGIGMKVK